MIRSLKKDQFRFLGTIILIAGVVIGTILVRYSAEMRQRAATSTGTASFLIRNKFDNTTYITPNAMGQLLISAVGTGQSNVDGFQLVATFTGNVPTDLTINPVSIPGLTLGASSISDIPGGKKLILMYITSSSLTPYNANNATVDLGTLMFTAPAMGTMTVTIDQTASKILQNTTGNDLLSLQDPITFSYQSAPVTAPIGTPTPTPTPESTSVPSTSLTIKTKFAGIFSDVGPINIKISDPTGSIGTIPFTATTNGVYQAIIPLPQKYSNPTQITLALKPEKHVARVFRNALISANTLDLSGTPFEPGDLPPQDGTVDMNDINQIITAISHASQTAADLTVADVNYDGVVNAVDVGLILATLSSKPDENL